MKSDIFLGKKENIAESVTAILETTPFLQEALKEGVVNYSALAEKIKPKVEIILKRETPISKEAILAAILRYKKSMPTPKISSKIIKTLSALEFSVKTNIRLLSIPKSYVKKEDILNLYKRFELASEERLLVFQGIKDVVLIADEPNFNYLKNYFESRLELLDENLALFIIFSPNIPKIIPGYLDFFVSKMAKEGINIEMFSFKEDLIFLINESDVSKVYQIVNNARMWARTLLRKDGIENEKE